MGQLSFLHSLPESLYRIMQRAADEIGADANSEMKFSCKTAFFHIYFPLNKMVLNKSSELLNLAFAYEDEAKIQSR